MLPISENVQCLTAESATAVLIQGMDQRCSIQRRTRTLCSSRPRMNVNERSNTTIATLPHRYCRLHSGSRIRLFLSPSHVYMWLDDGDRSSVLGLLEMPKAQVSPLRPSRSLSTCDDRNLDVNINNSISFNDDELVHWSKHGLNWKPSTSTDATGGFVYLLLLLARCAKLHDLGMCVDIRR